MIGIPSPASRSFGSSVDGTSANTSRSSAAGRSCAGRLPKSTAVARSARASPSGPCTSAVTSSASRRCAARAAGFACCAAMTSAISSSGRNVNALSQRSTSRSSAFSQNW